MRARLHDIIDDVNLADGSIRTDCSRDLDSGFSLTPVVQTVNSRRIWNIFYSQPEDARDRKAMELLTSMITYLNLTRELQNLCNLTSWWHSCRHGHI